MGDYDYNSLFLGTELSTNRELGYDDRLYDIDTDAFEVNGDNIRHPPDFISLYGDVNEKFDCGLNKATIVAYDIGLPVFRNQVAKDINLWNAKKKCFDMLILNTDNKSRYNSRFNERVYGLDTSEVCPHKQGYKQKYVYFRSSEYSEVEDNYVNRLDLGCWVHRFILALGLSQSDYIMKHKGYVVDEIIQNYSRELSSIFKRYDEIYVDLVNQMITSEWGMGDIPGSISDQLAFILSNTEMFDDGYVDYICQSNPLVAESIDKLDHDR